MLSLCSDEHEEVCFSVEVDCPVCEMERQKDVEVSELNEQIIGLQRDLERAQSKN